MIGIFADNDWGIFADNDSLSDIRYRGQMTGGCLLIMIHFLIQGANDWGIFADNDPLSDTEDK